MYLLRPGVGIVPTSSALTDQPGIQPGSTHRSQAPDMSRFGASKFRNAIPAVPPQTEWYRSALPSGASSSNLQTSTFSSEVKANHFHIVTLASNGDASWRGYSSAGAEDVAADAGTSPGTGSGKLGSGMIGDWDVSQVGSGDVVVGCADGSVGPVTFCPSQS